MDIYYYTVVCQAHPVLVFCISFTARFRKNEAKV